MGEGDGANYGPMRLEPRWRVMERTPCGGSIEIPLASFNEPATVNRHIDGPTITWACYIDWLTFRERVAYRLGLISVHELALRRWPQYADRLPPPPETQEKTP